MDAFTGTLPTPIDLANFKNHKNKPPNSSYSLRRYSHNYFCASNNTANNLLK